MTINTNFLKITLFVTFIVCLILTFVFVIINKLQTETIVLRSDVLMEELAPLDIQEALDEDRVKSLLSPDYDNYDRDFKLALFYSQLSIRVLALSKEKKNLVSYNHYLYNKTIQKWDELIKDDKEILYFKTNFVKKYRETYFLYR